LSVSGVAAFVLMVIGLVLTAIEFNFHWGSAVPLRVKVYLLKFD